MGVGDVSNVSEHKIRVPDCSLINQQDVGKSGGGNGYYRVAKDRRIKIIWGRIHVA